MGCLLHSLHKWLCKIDISLGYFLFFSCFFNYFDSFFIFSCCCHFFYIENNCCKKRFKIWQRSSTKKASQISKKNQRKFSMVTGLSKSTLISLACMFTFNYSFCRQPGDSKFCTSLMCLQNGQYIYVNNICKGSAV